MGGAGGAEELQGARLKEVVSAPPTAAGRVRTRAARVERGDCQGARAADSGQQEPRGRPDAGPAPTNPFTLTGRGDACY